MAGGKLQVVEDRGTSENNVGVTPRHGPCGTVTRTDENGRLDKVGKLEVDPQRIRGRSSVGALRSRL